MDSQPRIVIIGAGPAGCAAAYTLAQSGVLPLLLEKGLPRKDKACGDAWIPSAVEQLRSFEIGERELGASWHPFSRVDGYFVDRKVWSTEFAPLEGVIARRAVVDQVLRDRVCAEGCPIWYGARATNLQAIGGRIMLRVKHRGNSHTLSPAAVILASGSGCHIARETTLDGETVLGASISSYLPSGGVVSVPTFLFGDPSPGYGWIFPSGADSSNVGICALAKSGASALRLQMKKLLTRLEVPDSLPMRGGLGAMWSGKGTKWHHEIGVVSCGDAAGLVDPTSGEGLTAALSSGKRAGTTIASFLAGELGALVGYSRWIREWGQIRYAPSIENRILAGWVGQAPTERRLFALLSGLKFGKGPAQSAPGTAI